MTVDDPSPRRDDSATSGRRRAARWLAGLPALVAAATPPRFWEWGAVERVSTGLLRTKVGLQPGGRDMLAAAERVAE